MQRAGRDPTDAPLSQRQVLLWWAALCLGAVGLSWWLGLPLGRLFQRDGWQYVAKTLGGFLRPELSGAFVWRVVRLMAESVAIGALGLLGSLLLAVPLALLAARLPELPDPPEIRSGHRWPGRVRRAIARGVLVFLRGIPTLVWAFLFVRVFGLGPGPAVFAIALSFAGIIGKLYAEQAEAVSPGPILRLRAAGASSLAVVMLGVWPQVRGAWVGYAWFRLECALRSAAILGVVGAGGIGAEIALSLRYFQFGRLATSLLALFVVVVLFELMAGALRRRDWRWSAFLLVAGALWGSWSLALPWSSLWAPSARQQMLQFALGFASPALEPGWLWKSVVAMGQTLAMAWLATLAAAAIALALSPLASAALWGRGALDDPPGAGAVWREGRWLPWLCLGGIKALFQLCRAMPSLVWALLFVLWVGPGPLAGCLAIGCHTVGILGRLFGEVYADAPHAPLRSLEADGVGFLGRWLYGLLPTCAPQLLAFASFRFEVNLRATAILGFVGAGGIGDAIHTALSLFHFRRLASLLLVLLLCVVVVDTLGQMLRRRWLQTQPFSHKEQT